jgi:hypothetical protein
MLDGFNNKAIADYSAALDIRPETYIRRERANLERGLRQFNAAGRDYLGLLAEQRTTTTIDADAYDAMATEIASQVGITPLALTQLRQASIMAERVKPMGIFGLKTTEGDICKIDFDLILCGNKNDLKRISKIAFDDDRVVEGELQFLKAAALRELDRNKDSSTILSRFDTDNYMGFRTGIETQSLRAHLKIDNNDGTAAERLLDEYKVKMAKAQAEEKREANGISSDDITTDGYSENWSLNLASAWAAFNQQKYELALKHSNEAAVELSVNMGDIAKYQGSAANHLLRAHIFEAQNLREKAKDERMAYGKNHFSGAFFVPKIYRQWLSN